MTRDGFHGHLFIFAANFIFGVNYAVSKWLLAGHVTPEFHTLARMVAACALFWGISFFLPREKLSLKEILVLLLCSTCGVAGNQTLFVFGLSMTSPVDASVLSTGTPIFVILLAAIFLREPITRMKCAGALTGAAGAIWLVLQSGATQNGGNSASLAGDLCIVASCVIYSVYFVFSKPLSVKYQAVTMMKWMFLFAAIEVTPLTLPVILRPNGAFPQPPDMQVFAALAYVLVGATFLAYMLIPMAVRRIRPTTASMYNYVQPVVACALAIVLAQDKFSWDKPLAAIVVFLGVHMVSRSGKKCDSVCDKKLTTDS